MSTLLSALLLVLPSSADGRSRSWCGNCNRPSPPVKHDVGPLGRDPMLSPLDLHYLEHPDEKPAPAPPPPFGELELQGLVHTAEGGWAAVIGGELLRPGDRIRDATVWTVDGTGVTFRRRGRTLRRSIRD